MSNRNHSRREFLKRNSITGLGAILATGIAPSMFASSLFGKVDTASEPEPIIDIHQHTNYLGRNDDQLRAHQKALGIAITILQPAGSAVEYGSTYYGVANGLQAEATGNEACYNLSRKYPQEFFFGANEVPDLPGSIQEIEKYLKLGAKVIGECKFGVECDSAEMQRLYQLAEAYEVPILMHWEHNMYNRGFERFHKMLKKYQHVNFIGHAQTWWANIDKDNKDQNVLYPRTKISPGGLTDQLLSDYPNIYGDFSAGSGFNSLTRDEDRTPEFLKKHQDRLLFGSDCSDRNGPGPDCVGSKTIAAIRRLSPEKSIERKLLYENAKKLFKI